MVKHLVSFLFLLPFSFVYADGPKVRALSVIEVETGETLMVLEEGSVINLAALGKQQITILAETDPPKVTRVLFGLDAFPRYRDENAAPYALAGDRKGRFTPWTPKLGNHVLTVTPYSQEVAGDILKVRFSVVKNVPVESNPIVDLPLESASEVAHSVPPSEASTPTLTPTLTPSPSPTQAAIPTPSPTQSESPTATPTEMPTPVETPLPSVETTPSPTAVETPSATPTVTPKATPTPTPQKLMESLIRADFSLSGMRVVPPSNSTASGRCVASLDILAGELSIGCTHTIIGPTRAGLYEGGTGEEGKELCKFESAESPIVATCAVTPLQIEAFERGALYLEIRSIAYGAGDLRGQVISNQGK